jgi:hypothetical protein
MGEGMIPQEIEKEAQEFKAGRTGDESLVARGAEERAAEEAPRETLSGRIKAVQEAKAKPEEKPEAPAGSLKARIEEAREAKLARFESFEARDESGSVATIPAVFAKTEYPVRPEFRRYPEPRESGTLMYLEKGGETKFYRALIPKTGEGKVQPFVSKLPENTVYIRTEIVNREEVVARRMQAEDMRDYLTDGTLDKLGLARPESQPEALRQAA